MTSRWPNVRLGELLRQVERIHPIDPTRTYRLLGVRWYAQGLFVREEKLGAEIAATRAYSVQPGDFIYNRLFAWKGAFAVAGNESTGAHVSNEFPTFVTDPSRLDAKFLLWTFRQQRTWATALGLSSGATPTSRNRLKETAFLAMEIPLPPLVEQRRIVARIEPLAARVDEARQLRSGLLSASEALSRACTERAYRSLVDRVGLQRLEEVCDSVTDGDHTTPSFCDHGVRFVFVGNVSSGRLHFRNTKFVSREYFRHLKPQRIPRLGDLLYSAVGATLGVPAVVDTDEPFCFQRHVAILKLNPLLADSRFVWHMLRSQTVFESAWSSVTGSAQPTVPLRAIRQLQLPVPPLDEQRRIGAELDALEAPVDGLRQHQTEVDFQLRAVLPAILSRAFLGDL